VTPTSRWPDKFFDNYGRNIKLLQCPNDTDPAPQTIGGSPSNNVADASPRSYLINGFNDLFSDKVGSTAWGTVENYMWSNPGLKNTEIPHVSETCVLGEKRYDHGDFYMDLLEPNGPGAVGNDFTGILEQSRHEGRGPESGSGGSNFTFADGHAQYMKVNTSVKPLNLWAVTDSNRVAYAAQ
jgi:prepilin-type processing-associated H-X9-DG protein